MIEGPDLTCAHAVHCYRKLACCRASACGLGQQCIVCSGVCQEPQGAVPLSRFPGEELVMDSSQPTINPCLTFPTLLQGKQPMLSLLMALALCLLLLQSRNDDEDDDALEASLIADMSNEDDWGLESLMNPAISSRRGRRSLLDELSQQEAAADGFEEGSLAAENVGSVQWGGSAGTTGIDLEEQEELLRRYFKPDQVCGEQLQQWQEQMHRAVAVNLVCGGWGDFRGAAVTAQSRRDRLCLPCYWSRPVPPQVLQSMLFLHHRWRPRLTCAVHPCMQVKKLMKDQVEIDASYSEFRVGYCMLRSTGLLYAEEQNRSTCSSACMFERVLLLVVLWHGVWAYFTGVSMRGSNVLWHPRMLQADVMMVLKGLAVDVAADAGTAVVAAETSSWAGST